MLLALKISSIVNLPDHKESIVMIVSAFLNVLEAVGESIGKFKYCSRNMTVMFRILSSFKESIFSAYFNSNEAHSPCGNSTKSNKLSEIS